MWKVRNASKIPVRKPRVRGKEKFQSESLG